MTRSNDFSDRAAYILQLIIPETISKVRDNGGNTPMRVKRFLYEKLKFNDNSNNEVRKSKDKLLLPENLFNTGTSIRTTSMLLL